MGVEASFKLKLVGTFGLFAPDGARIPISSKKGAALIALLAMARGGERSRTWLQDQLWGSRPSDQAQASLRRELSNLRSVMNDAAPLIAADMARVRLDLDRVIVDVRILEPDVARGTASWIEDGEFLEGLDIAGEEGFEDWLRTQRQLVEDLVEQARARRWEARVATLASPNAHFDPADATLAHAGEVPASDRPSVAVLGLAATPNDESTNDLAVGVSEEIGVSLSRYSTMLVVQGGPIDRERGEASNPGQLCRRLGVRYLLDGRLTRAGEEIRIAVRLIDGLIGEQLWAERFQGPLADLFATQERIAATVAPIIDSSIEIAERKRALAEPVGSATAYHLYWRANALFRRWERASMVEAIGLTRQVLEMEPENSWAASMGSFCLSIASAFGWLPEAAEARREALALYERAMRTGGNDPFVLGYSAGALLALGTELDVADALIDRALQINPDISATLFWGGWVDIARGNFDRAPARFERAKRLNPRSAVRPHMLTGLGISLLARGETDEALGLLTQALQELPHYPVTVAALAAAHARAGRVEQARDYARRLEDLGGAAAASGLLRSAKLDGLLVPQVF